ncbi:unnamed protein product [Symbiodinium natans]|uniref:Uncharacterized protein n=1 Tax=Symbiodinium natans TaxID=878477 RepID=A0A812S916_9DINO|nr:unnamed protein product [Symbiodinium natans]
MSSVAGRVDLMIPPDAGLLVYPVLKDCGQRGRLFREIPKPEARVPFHRKFRGCCVQLGRGCQAGADGPKSLWPEATGCEGYGLSSEARAELRASNRQAEENARQSRGLAEELLTLYRQQFNRDPKTADHLVNFARGLQRKLPYRAAAQLLARSPAKV